MTGTRALIFGHTRHYSLVLVSHYAMEPLLTEFGSNCGPTRLVTILLQVFANFLDTLGPGNKIANIAPQRFLNVLRPPNLQGTLLVTIPSDSDHFQLNRTCFRKCSFLFISFITGTRALIFGRTRHYSLVLVSHYIKEPI